MRVIAQQEVGNDCAAMQGQQWRVGADGSLDAVYLCTHRMMSTRLYVQKIRNLDVAEFCKQVSSDAQ